MSYVADVILVTAIEDSSDERPNVDRLNEWINTRHGIPDALRGFDEHAGGVKAMQCDLYGTAINYLDVDGLVTAFRAAPWTYPECAQLMIKNEHDDLFTVYLTEPLESTDHDTAPKLTHALLDLSDLDDARRDAKGFVLRAYHAETGTPDERADAAIRYATGWLRAAARSPTDAILAANLRGVADALDDIDANPDTTPEDAPHPAPEDDPARELARRAWDAGIDAGINACASDEGLRGAQPGPKTFDEFWSEQP